MAAIAEAIQMVVDSGAGDSGGVQNKYTEMREMITDVEMTANYRLNYLLQQLRLVSVSLYFYSLSLEAGRHSVVVSALASINVVNQHWTRLMVG